MTNILKPLDESLAYMYCPTCRDAGTPNVQLRRSMHEVVCPFGHKPQFAYTKEGTLVGVGQAQAGSDMVPFSHVMKESPASTWIKWPIYVHPEVKAKIETKYPENWITSIGVLLNAFADGSLIMITGEEATKLRTHGIKNGAQMVSCAEGMKEAERERDQAVKELDKLQSVLKAAGI